MVSEIKTVKEVNYLIEQGIRFKILEHSTLALNNINRSEK